MRTRRLALKGLAPVLALALSPVLALAGTSSPATAPPVLRDPKTPIAGPRRIVPAVSRAKPRPEPVFIARDGTRITPARIRSFLRRKRSPMAPYAELIVAEGLRWRVDPRVVVAIAGHESSFGLIRRGFNAWGWNVRTTRYASWENAIRRFTKAFSIHYPGMREGNFWSGARVYDPPDPASWVRACRAYFNAI